MATGCAVDGCGRKRVVRGWCDMHYRRWRKCGETGPAASATDQQRPESCTVEGCTRPFVAKGMCQHHYRKQWYAANRQEIADYNAGYYDANREKYAEWNRQWSQDNRTRKTLGGIAWRAQNYEQQVRYRREWRLTNTELLRRYGEQRKELERVMPTVPFTFEQWQQKVAYYGGKCWICRVADFEHVDHVKPLSKGGSHMLANLRPACAHCNRSKNRTWPFDVAAFRRQRITA